MRYLIRQKVFSIVDKFTIKDELGNDSYFVRGKVLSIGNKLFLEDMQGNELLYIEQKIFRFLTEYNLYANGENVANVKRQFTFLKPKFNITSSQGDYTVEGNVLAHEFTILKDNNLVAQVSKKWFSFSDSYAVEIFDTENIPFLIALTIVVDQVLYDNRGHGSGNS